MHFCQWNNKERNCNLQEPLFKYSGCSENLTNFPGKLKRRSPITSFQQIPPRVFFWEWCWVFRNFFLIFEEHLWTVYCKMRFTRSIYCYLQTKHGYARPYTLRKINVFLSVMIKYDVLSQTRFHTWNISFLSLLKLNYVKQLPDSRWYYLNSIKRASHKQ